ncbi:histidine kinase [Undibacterium sp. BYS107W]|uniref:Histidine kinase n=2 Tax=Undibacterium baiyunense TaxID=2828731 RepID=A0A941DBW7_9BURK|nr:histidine kinase [Undibacterium baiyunense]
MVPVMLAALSLTTVGQAMAVWVRQKNFASRKETILLCVALLSGVAISYGVAQATDNLAKFVIYGDANYKVVSKNKKSNADHQQPSASATADAASASAQTPASVPAETSAASSTKSEANSASVAKPETKEKPVDNDSVKLDKLIQLIIGSFPIAFLIIYTASGFDLWFFFRQRKRLAEALRQQELKRAQDARREAELRLSVLVAQVEPHFLFNTLAGVRSAILTEPLRATAIVDHLVDYLRSTIPQMRGDGTSEQGRLAKQLEAARAYLGLMQARIPRLSYSVESELKDAAFPPLLLISLVENAIKHGIEPKIGPVHVAVNARYFDDGDEEKLEVSVSDNGVGFGGTTSGSGIGLANIRERLESMYGDKAKLTLKARPEGGVIASIVIPLIA